MQKNACLTNREEGTILPLLCAFRSNQCCIYDLKTSVPTENSIERYDVRETEQRFPCKYESVHELDLVVETK